MLFYCFRQREGASADFKQYPFFLQTTVPEAPWRFSSVGSCPLPPRGDLLDLLRHRAFGQHLLQGSQLPEVQGVDADGHGQDISPRDIAQGALAPKLNRHDAAMADGRAATPGGGGESAPPDGGGPPHSDAADPCRSCRESTWQRRVRSAAGPSRGRGR